MKSLSGFAKSKNRGRNSVKIREASLGYSKMSALTLSMNKEVSSTQQLVVSCRSLLAKHERENIQMLQDQE